MRFDHYSREWTSPDGLTSNQYRACPFFSTRKATTPARTAVQNVDVRIISSKEETFNTWDNKPTPKQVNGKSSQHKLPISSTTKWILYLSQIYESNTAALYMLLMGRHRKKPTHTMWESPRRFSSHHSNISSSISSRIAVAKEHANQLHAHKRRTKSTLTFLKDCRENPNPNEKDRKSSESDFEAPTVLHKNQQQ